MSTSYLDSLLSNLPKQPELTRASEEDRNELANLNPSSWTALKDKEIGMGSASPVERDARTLTPQQLVDKYGFETANAYWGSHDEAMNRASTLLQDSKQSPVDLLQDATTGIVGGVARGLFDTAGFIASGAGTQPNVVSEVLGSASDRVSDLTQSARSNAGVMGSELSDLELGLRVRDNRALRNEERANGTGSVVANLKEMGRNFIDTFASQNTASVTGFIAEGVGSTAASIPVIGQTSKAANALSKLAQTSARTRAIAPSIAAQTARGEAQAARIADQLTRYAPTTTAVLQEQVAARTANNINRLNRLTQGVPGIADTVTNRTLLAMPGIAAMELGGTISDVSNQIGAMSHEELMEISPEYNRKLIAHMAEGKSEAQARKLAKDELITTATRAAVSTSLVPTLAASALGGWLNRAPLGRGTAPALSNRTWGELGREMLSEGTEEFIQGISGTYAGNVAMRTVNPSQELTEGVGESAAQGLIGGIGTPVAIAGGRRVLTEGVSDVTNVATATAQAAGKVAGNVARTLQVKETEKSDTQGTMQYEPTELPQEAQEVVQEVEVKKPTLPRAIQEIAVQLGKETEPNEIMRKGEAFYQLKAEAEQRLESLINKEDITEEEKQEALVLSNNMNKLFNSERVLKSESHINKAAQSQIESNTVEPENTIKAFALATRDYDYSKLTAEGATQQLENLNTILDNEGTELNAALRFQLEAHRLNLRVTNEALAQSSLEGRTPEELASASTMLLRENAVKVWEKSVVQHVKKIANEWVKGDMQNAGNSVEDFQAFATHMSNKAQASLQALQAPYGKGDKVAKVPYESLSQVTRNFRDSRLQKFETKEVWNNFNPKAIRFLQANLGEAATVINAYNSLIDLVANSLPEEAQRNSVLESKVPALVIPSNFTKSPDEILKMSKAGTLSTPNNRNTENVTENVETTPETGSEAVRDAGRESRASESTEATEGLSTQEPTQESTQTGSAQEIRTQEGTVQGSIQEGRTQERQGQTSERPKMDSEGIERAKQSQSLQQEEITSSPPPVTVPTNTPKTDTGGVLLPKAKNQKAETHAKDQAKTDKATAFIGEGSPGSNANRYREAWGDRANKGSYTAEDVVHVSTNGGKNKASRIPFNQEELDRAIAAGATILTDIPTDRKTPYNMGEREVATYLSENGYIEPQKDGVWVKGEETKPKKATKKVATPKPQIEEEEDTDYGDFVGTPKPKSPPTQSTSEVVNPSSDPEGYGDFAAKPTKAPKPTKVQAKAPEPTPEPIQNPSEAFREDSVDESVGRPQSMTEEPVEEDRGAVLSSLAQETQTDVEASTKNLFHQGKDLFKVSKRRAGNPYVMSQKGNEFLKTDLMGWSTPNATLNRRVQEMFEGDAKKVASKASVQQFLNDRMYEQFTYRFRKVDIKDAGIDLSREQIKTKNELRAYIQKYPDVREALLATGLDVLTGTGNPIMDRALFFVKLEELGDYSNHPDWGLNKVKNKNPGGTNHLDLPEHMFMGLLDSTGSKVSDLAVNTVHLVVNQVIGDSSLFNTSILDQFPAHYFKANSGAEYNRAKPYLDKSTNGPMLQRMISQSIKDQLNLAENKDMPLNKIEGFYHSMSLQVIRYMESKGLIQKEQITLQGPNDSKITPWFYTRRLPIVDSDLILSKELNRMVGENTEAGNQSGWSIKEPGKASFYKVDGFSKNNALQRKIINDLITNNPFKIDKGVLDEVNKFSPEEIADRFFPLPNRHKAHPDVVIAVDSQRNNFINAIKETQAIKLSIELAGQDAFNTPIFFDINSTSVDRFQFKGSYNPQGNKLMRELVLATYNTIDPKNPEHMEHFFRGVLQAVGGKPAKMTRDQVREAIKPVLTKFNRIKKQGNLPWFSQEMKNQLVNAFGEKDYSPLMIHVGMEVFKYLDNPTESFESSLYLELDGVHSGPTMLTLIYGTDSPFEEKTKHLMELGGLTPSSEPVSQAEIYADGRPDFYGEVAQGVSEELLTAGTSDVAPELREVLFSQVAEAVEGAYIEDGELWFNRNAFKDPVMITTYGAGDRAVANIHADEMIKTMQKDINDWQTGVSGTRAKVAQWDQFLTALLETPVKLTPNAVLSRKQISKIKNTYTEVFSEVFRNELDTRFGPALANAKELVRINEIIDKALISRFNKDMEALINEQRKAGIIGPKDMMTKGAYESLIRTYKEQGISITNNGLNNIPFMKWGSQVQTKLPKFATYIEGSKTQGYAPYLHLPSLSGVSILAKSVQGMGDVRVLQEAASKMKGVEAVHDGVNVSPVNAIAYSKLLNRGVEKVAQTNIYKDYLDSLRRVDELFELNVEGMTTLNSATREREPALIYETLEELASRRGNFVFTFSNTPYSIDHMGGAAQPYLTQSESSHSKVVIEPENVRAWINNRTLPDDSNVIVNTLFKTFTSNNRTPSIVITDNNVIMAGNDAAFDRGSNTIYLSRNHSDNALVHELIHAATYQVLSTPVESLSQEARESINRLNQMYDRILKSDKPEVQALVQQIKSNTSSRAEELMEFVAYGLTDHKAILQAFNSRETFKGIALKIIKRLLGLDKNIEEATTNTMYDGLLFHTVLLSNESTNIQSSGVLFHTAPTSIHLEEARDVLKGMVQSAVRKRDDVLGPTYEFNQVVHHLENAEDELLSLKAQGFSFDEVEHQTFINVYAVLDTNDAVQVLNTPELSSMSERFMNLLEYSLLPESQKTYLNSIPGSRFHKVFIPLLLTNEPFQSIVQEAFDRVSPVDRGRLLVDPEVIEISRNHVVEFTAPNPVLLEVHLEAKNAIFAEDIGTRERMEQEPDWIESEPNLFIHSTVLPIKLDRAFLGTPVTYEDRPYTSLAHLLSEVEELDRDHLLASLRVQLAENPKLLSLLENTGVQPLIHEDERLVDLFTQLRSENRVEDNYNEEPEPSPLEYGSSLLRDIQRQFSKPPKRVDEVARATIKALEETVARREENLAEQALGALGSLQRSLDEKGLDFMHRASNALEKAGEKVRDNAVTKKGKFLGETMNLTASLLSAQKTEDRAETINTLLMSAEVPNVVQELVRDVIGKTDSNRDVLSLMKKNKAATQQVRQLYRQELPATILSYFKEVPSKEELSIMTEGLMKTDIAAIQGSSEEILQLLQDQDARWNRTRGLMRRMSAVQLEKADQLVRYMNTGIPGSMLLRNADEISRYDPKTKQLKTKGNINQTKVIDEYVSLRAYENKSDEVREGISILVEREGTAIKKVINILKGMKLSRTKEGREMGFKGHIPYSPRTGQTIQVFEEKDWVEMKRRGWVMKGEAWTPKRIVSRLGVNDIEKKAYFYLPADAQSRFSQGIIQDIHQSTNGVYKETGWTSGMNLGIHTDRVSVKYIQNLSEDQFNHPESFIPVFTKEGELKGFESLPDQNIMNMLDPETELHMLIGIGKGRSIEETRAQMTNEHFIDRVMDMFKKEHGPLHPSQEGFQPKEHWVDVLQMYRDMRIGGVKKDPVFMEAVEMIPRETLEYAKKQYGAEVLYLRKDLLTQALGYRQASVRDLYTGNHRLNKEYTEVAREWLDHFFGMTGAGYKSLLLAEKWIQEGVQVARSTIVVRSGKVALANIFSNLVQLKMRRVSAKELLVHGRVSYREVQEYLKNRKKGIQFQTELASLEPGDIKRRTQLVKQIDFIKERNQKLSIWPLLERGEFTSIQDGAGMSDTVEEIRTTGMMNAIEQHVYGNIKNEKARRALREITMDTNSSIFRFMQNTVQLGDFLSKAVLYQSYLNRGMSSDIALDKINEEYIDYDLLPGRTRGAFENMGLIWFANYSLRSMKVALNIIQENPVTGLLGFSAATTYDWENPIKDTLPGKVLRGTIGYSYGPGQGYSAPFKHPMLAMW